MKKIFLLLGGLIIIGLSAFYMVQTDKAQAETNKKNEIINANEINASGVLLADNANKYKEKLKDKHIIAKLNEETILYDEFLFKKLMMETKAKIKKTQVPSEQDIFNMVIRDKTNTLLAKKLGVYPSSEEIQNYIKGIRDMVEEGDNPEALLYFTQNFGISEEQYWNEWSVPLYTQDLINQKVSQELAKQVAQNENESSAEYIKRVQTHVKKTIDNFEKNAKVEITDTTLGISSPR